MNSRSKWKGPYINVTQKKSKSLVKRFKTNRSSEVLPKYVGSAFYVHNGKKLVEVNVIPEMIGHKFGEFVFTRCKYEYKKKKKSKSKNQLKKTTKK